MLNNQAINTLVYLWN